MAGGMQGRRLWLGLVTIAGLLGAGGWWLEHRVARGDEPLAARWPEPGHRLRPLPNARAARAGAHRIALDPGHGAAGNPGNVSARCESEQDFTLWLARELATRLTAAGDFEVLLCRDGSALVEYADRVAAAEDWGAEAFVSLHSDVRGRPVPAVSDAAGRCPATAEEPGVSVLWSDEGPPELVASRHALAEACAARLLEIGLPAYDGAGYGLYERDEGQPGVFADRHAPGERIFVLRAPTMPSVIVETHNARHPDEVARWREPTTIDAVASALAAALRDALP